MKKDHLPEDLVHSLLILAGFVGFMIFSSVKFLVVVAFISFGRMLFINRDVFRELKPFGGYANWVTIFRLVLLCLLGFNYQQFDHFSLAVLAVFVLSLDGLDGFIARKMSMNSAFGGRLDGETDAWFVLLMGTVVYQLKLADYWILWPGLLRYIFVLSCYLLWKKTLPEPVSYFRKTIAVIIMAALVSPFILAEKYYFPALVAASGLVTYSFGKSFVFQWRQNRLAGR